ncbi:hypothetical protein ABZ471_27290 [Streptomyces sp. NPDC005728]|uniref:hypothetical protein n=1 Tax=Streptomyces sp. NPDC005728 TaxID=3157054 RepID=UPI0033D47AED
MRARRVLAIAIATPVLLATIGMTGASAATLRKPTPDVPVMQPEPNADGASRDNEEFGDDEMRPEEGFVNTFAGDLMERFSPTKTGKTGASSPDKF